LIIDLDLPKNLNARKVSNYNPSKEVKQVTKMVMSDFSLANEIRNKPYREFNDKSLLERMAADQKAFNSYQDPQSTDPDEAWKSNAIRPITRNKIISIAAHITGSIIYPNIFAQNDQDEEDKDAAVVMKDLMEWAGDQSDYEKTFVFAVIAALVNPAVIVHTEYADVMRKVKEITEKGDWTTKEVRDEILSGFIDSIIPLDEFFKADFYINNIQRQPYLIWRKAINFREAEAKYSDKENWKYVQPGLQVLFDSDRDTFYEQFEENLRERLVEEVIYYNRSKDLQLVFVNGVLITKHDQPNPRKDKRYPFAETGYELIDEGKFAWYKSLAFKMGPDQENINRLHQMIVDGTFLEVWPATATFGSEAVNSAVIVPGKNTAFIDPQTKMERIGPNINLQAGYNTLDRLENSVSESSSDPRQAGQESKGPQTAFEVSRLEQNARTMLGLFGKMIGNLVKDFGELRISDILQFLTVGDVAELSNGLKYRSFVLPNKTVDGKNKSRKIEFTTDLPEEPITEDQQLDMSYDLLEEEGGPDSSIEICKANPRLFRRRKFLLRVTPDVVTPPSENVKKALDLELYDRAITNPLADQEAITRDFLFGAYDASKGDTDKYIRKQDPMAAMMGMSPDGGAVNALANPGKPGGTNELMQKVV
jgi:hypothetical protein